MVNVLMLYLSLIGMGAVGGYGVFYYLFSDRCISMISSMENKHTAALNALQTKYDEAVENQNKCKLETSKAEEGHVKARLETQTALSDRHHALLDKHEETLGRLSKAHAAQEASANTVAELKNELARTKVILDNTVRLFKDAEAEKNDIEQELSTEIEDMQEEMKSSRQKLQTVANDSESCSRMLPAMTKELRQVKEFVRARYFQKCRME